MICTGDDHRAIPVRRDSRCLVTLGGWLPVLRAARNRELPVERRCRVGSLGPQHVGHSGGHDAILQGRSLSSRRSSAFRSSCALGDGGRPGPPPRPRHWASTAAQAPIGASPPRPSLRASPATGRYDPAVHGEGIGSTDAQRVVPGSRADHPGNSALRQSLPLAGYRVGHMPAASRSASGRSYGRGLGGARGRLLRHEVKRAELRPKMKGIKRARQALRALDAHPDAPTDFRVKAAPAPARWLARWCAGVSG